LQIPLGGIYVLDETGFLKTCHTPLDPRLSRHGSRMIPLFTLLILLFIECIEPFLLLYFLDSAGTKAMNQMGR
jgi:hypothetical protein